MIGWFRALHQNVGSSCLSAIGILGTADFCLQKALLLGSQEATTIPSLNASEHAMLFHACLFKKKKPTGWRRVKVLAVSLTWWLGSTLESTWWKEKTSFHKLSSDLYLPAVTCAICTYKHMYIHVCIHTCTINVKMQPKNKNKTIETDSDRLLSHPWTKSCYRFKHNHLRGEWHY